MSLIAGHAPGGAGGTEGPRGLLKSMGFKRPLETRLVSKIPAYASAFAEYQAHNSIKISRMTNGGPLSGS